MENAAQLLEARLEVSIKHRKIDEIQADSCRQQLKFLLTLVNPGAKMNEPQAAWVAMTVVDLDNTYDDRPTPMDIVQLATFVNSCK